jgi:hypothetical protein
MLFTGEARGKVISGTDEKQKKGHQIYCTEKEKEERERKYP